MNSSTVFGYFSSSTHLKPYCTLVGRDRGIVPTLGPSFGCGSDSQRKKERERKSERCKKGKKETENKLAIIQILSSIDNCNQYHEYEDKVQILKLKTKMIGK
jgi:hypothetical protein